MDTRQNKAETNWDGSVGPAVTALRWLNVSFLVSLPFLAGIDTVLVPDANVAAYAHDPEACPAWQYDVSRGALRRWIDDGFAVLCVARTVHNRPFRRAARGGTGHRVKAWASLHGSVCPAHEPKVPSP